MKNGVFFSECFQEGILIDFGVDFGMDFGSQKALGDSGRAPEGLRGGSGRVLAGFRHEDALREAFGTVF